MLLQIISKPIFPVQRSFLLSNDIQAKNIASHSACKSLGIIYSFNPFKVYMYQQLVIFCLQIMICYLIDTTFPKNLFRPCPPPPPLPTPLVTNVHFEREVLYGKVYTQVAYSARFWLRETVISLAANGS